MFKILFARLFVKYGHNLTAGVTELADNAHEQAMFLAAKAERISNDADRYDRVAAKLSNLFG